MTDDWSPLLPEMYQHRQRGLLERGELVVRHLLHLRTQVLPVDGLLISRRRWRQDRSLMEHTGHVLLKHPVCRRRPDPLLQRLDSGRGGVLDILITRERGDGGGHRLILV